MMRKLAPAYVVTSVVIAVAGTAFAATTTSGAVAGGTNAARTAVTAGVPQAANSNVSIPSNTTGGTAGSITARSGSAGLDGSRSGNNTDSSAANTPIGSPSANGASAASANEAVTTIPALAPGVTGYINPAILNRTLGLTSDGERAMDGSGDASEQAKAIANAQLQYNGTMGAAAAADTARSSRSLDRAIREVEKDRKKIGRNGQLLQSITPRTNADRTSEMPDDGPTPTLSGSSSALTLR